jgi:hypothetical protein
MSRATFQGGVSSTGQALPEALAPGDIDYQLTKMTLLGHMRKRLMSLVEWACSRWSAGLSAAARTRTSTLFWESTGPQKRG